MKWQYKVYEVVGKVGGDRALELEAALLELGAEGWELIHVEPHFPIYLTLVLKRPTNKPN